MGKVKAPKDVTFAATKWREGYDMGEVDSFLDTIENYALDLRVDRISTARFTPVRGRQGYDMKDVDSYLDDLVAEYGRELAGKANARAVQDTFAEDEAALASDWDNVMGANTWRSYTVVTDPFEAPAPEALAAWADAANKTLADVLSSAKEKELARGLLQMVESYQSLWSTVELLEGVSIKTKAL